MKININNLNFGKIIINNNVNIRKANGEVGKVKFVEYEQDNKKDSEQIQSLDKEWNYNAEYMNSIASSFRVSQLYPNLYDEHNRFYGIEDKHGKVLAIANTVESKEIPAKGEDYLDILYLQANPKEMYSSKNKKYKGLGEVLVSEIVKVAKSKNKDLMRTESENNYFWDSQKYFRDIDIRSRELSKSDFNNHIEYVDEKIKKHTNN